MIGSNRKVVRMTTSGMRKRQRRQQNVKTHEVLTKDAYGKGGQQYQYAYKKARKY